MPSDVITSFNANITFLIKWMVLERLEDSRHIVLFLSRVIPAEAPPRGILSVLSLIHK